MWLKLQSYADPASKNPYPVLVNSNNVQYFDDSIDAHDRRLISRMVFTDGEIYLVESVVQIAAMLGV